MKYLSKVCLFISDKSIITVPLFFSIIIALIFYAFEAGRTALSDTPYLFAVFAFILFVIIFAYADQIRKRNNL